MPHVDDQSSYNVEIMQRSCYASQPIFFSLIYCVTCAHRYRFRTETELRPVILARNGRTSPTSAQLKHRPNLPYLDLTLSTAPLSHFEPTATQHIPVAKVLLDLSRLLYWEHHGLRRGHNSAVDIKRDGSHLAHKARRCCPISTLVRQTSGIAETTTS